MTKSNYLFNVCLLTGYLLPLFNNESPQDGINHFYKIINDNSQNTYIKKSKSELCCEDYVNSEFVECIFSLPIEDQKEVFKRLSPARKRKYLRNLNYEEYKKFLKAYSEYDWKNLYDSLSKHEQKHWPKTVREQLIQIKNIKKNAKNKNFKTDIGIFAAGMLISPVIYLSYYGYVGYGLLKDNKHPIKENYLAEYFKTYMESTFEI